MALTKILFEEPMLHVRCQGLQDERVSYDALRSFLMEQATIEDEERAAKGNIKSLEEDAVPAADNSRFEEGAWMKNCNGEPVWLEPQQLNALFKRKGKTGKG